MGLGSSGEGGGGGGWGASRGLRLGVGWPSPIWGYPASSGFSRPDATLRRERNHCEHPSASLIEPPSNAMDE